MKVGMIFESGPDGADRRVCEHLAKMLVTDVQIQPANHMNKPEMIEQCGDDVKHLMKQGCEKILIIWDLYPSWGGKPCRKQDREAIMESIKRVGMEKQPVFLICISEELEAWLLADGRALTAFLSTPEHKKIIEDNKSPDTVQNPKKRLTKIFQQSVYRKYNDHFHAIQIIRKINDLTKLKRYSPSFQRFAEKLTQ